MLSHQVLIMECGPHAGAVTLSPLAAERMTIGKAVAYKFNTTFSDLELRNVTLSRIEVQDTDVLDGRQRRFTLYPKPAVQVLVGLDNGRNGSSEMNSSISARLTLADRPLSRKDVYDWVDVLKGKLRRPKSDRKQPTDEPDSELLKLFLALKAGYDGAEIGYEIHGSVQSNNGVKLTVPLVTKKL